MNTDSNFDKDAIADNIERTVDKTALRKVRGLVEELETEHQEQHQLQKWALGIAAVGAIALFTWATVGKQRDLAAEERGACELAYWQQKMGALSADIKGRNPGIGHAELQRQLDVHRQSVQDAAAKSCAG